tara:strand:+ start:147 stop:401 length:255 start_codon:yes stop_codon:yes gene_type:complete
MSFEKRMSRRRERAKLRKLRKGKSPKTETQRVKELEKTDAVFRGTLSQRALMVARKNLQKGRTLSDKDTKRNMKMLSKQAKKKK